MICIITYKIVILILRKNILVIRNKVLRFGQLILVRMTRFFYLEIYSHLLFKNLSLKLRNKILISRTEEIVYFHFLTTKQEQDHLTRTGTPDSRGFDFGKKAKILFLGVTFSPVFHV